MSNVLRLDEEIRYGAMGELRGKVVELHRDLVVVQPKPSAGPNSMVPVFWNEIRRAQ